MILFINDIPVRIYKDGEGPPEGHYNSMIAASAEQITPARLINHVWIKEVGPVEFNGILDYLNSKVPTNLLSLYITVKDYAGIKTQLMARFKVIKAAGGLVRKKDKFLMIYRLKKWDFPKGKKEKGEKYRQTAQREIQEECNITVRLGRKICTTWHTYTMNKRAMIKKTRWYVMDLVDDSKMRPALEEDIEEVRWMTQKEVYHALEHSYKSIRYVYESYHIDKGGI